MFQDICLLCGKQLNDDSQAYCSEDCHSQDTSSPSISSASSALSSPNLGYATGGEVPALVPSALGSALNKYTRSRHHYSVSSSSASSTSWSVATDDEDDSYLGLGSYRNNPFYDSADSLFDGGSKSPYYVDTLKQSSALSYARRPSGTNNHSVVPNPPPHSRTNSAHVHGVPRSAPLHSHLSTDDDGGSSDIGFSSRDESDSESSVTKPLSVSKPKRNRASLPAYFSLLQMSSLSVGKRISPVSSSSGNTIARPSPPTPKLPLSGFPHSTATIAPHSSPRGRRRARDLSGDSRRSAESSSRSPSRTHRGGFHFAPDTSCSREADDEAVLDWPSVPGLGRGRPAVRRNSSPPPKMMPFVGVLRDDTLAEMDTTSRTEGALLAGFRKARGRAKADFNLDAPGYGQGRSGLLDRERHQIARSGRFL